MKTSPFLSLDAKGGKQAPPDAKGAGEPLDRQSPEFQGLLWEATPEREKANHASRNQGRENRKGGRRG